MREYDPFVVAEVPITVGGSKRDSAFRPLAKYLFGGNKEEKALSMTTPVFTSASTMQFVLPVASAADAPTPLAQDAPASQVSVKEVQLRFSLRLHVTCMSSGIEMPSKISAACSV